MALSTDHVVNYTDQPEWGHAVRQATDGRGVDLVVETFGADTTEQSMRAVGLHGQMNRRRPFMDQTQLNDFIGR